MVHRRIPVLKLPYWMRSILSIPLGKLFVKQDGLIDRSDLGFDVDACVGDIVCKVFSPDLRVVDGKTRRTYETGYTGGHSVLVNPKGTISILSRTLLTVQRRRLEVFVHGEEDLLVIPLALNRSINNIVYGQPRTGIVIVDLNDYSRLKFIKILKTFKPDMSG